MIVCSCHVVSDDEVRETFAVAEPPKTVAQVYRELGHKPHCGRCVHTVREMMDRHGIGRRRKNAL